MEDDKKLQDAVAAALAPLKADFAKLSEANVALTTENTALKQQVKTFEADKAKAAIDGKRARCKTVLEGLTVSGAITPAQRETFSKFLGVDDDTKVVAADIEGFLAGFSVKETVGADGKVMFAKPGAGDVEKPANDGKYTFETASEALDKRTKELMSEKSLTYSAAKDAVLASDETLAAAYSAGPA